MNVIFQSSAILRLFFLLTALQSSCTFHLTCRLSDEIVSRRSAITNTAGAIVLLSEWLVAAPAKAAISPSSANPVSYQGVFVDPKHPKGYRILYGDDKNASLKLQDDPSSDEIELPVKIENKAGTELIFDFTSKGGPKNIAGVLAETGGEITLTFPDGNVWKKDTSGIMGVYKDSNNPKSSIAIRQWRSNELKVSIIDNEKTVSFGAKGGSQKVFFEYPGEFNKSGKIDSDQHTISFKDGMVWTRY